MIAEVSKAIDPARVGISKSTMTTPCERKAVYHEVIRDAAGRRLSWPMPEKVVFGSALDDAHSYIVASARAGVPWSIAEARAHGMERARESGSRVEDWSTFELQLSNALVLFLEQPDGWTRLAPELDGIRIQGLNGESLRADDIVGTPDYLLADWSVVDLKTSAKKYTPAKFTQSPEMALYAWLVAQHTGGVIAPRLAYQVYVRVQKPYWQWLETPGLADHVLLGAEHVAHWRALMAHPDPALASVTPSMCGDCGFREPMPEYGHGGCVIGLMQVPEEEAA